MIGSSDVNLLRMNNKLVVNIGKMTYFGLLNFTNFVVGMMQKYYQSANTVHCFTYSTFHDQNNSVSVSAFCRTYCRLTWQSQPHCTG